MSEVEYNAMKSSGKIQEGDIASASNYYPFGMTMPGRSSHSDKYRYGFNGKEKDNDLHGQTVYDYGFRIYNPALGKFLSVYPLTKSYPWYTPYQFAGNMPIWAIDLDGLEEKKVTYHLVKYADGTFYVIKTDVDIDLTCMFQLEIEILEKK